MAEIINAIRNLECGFRPTNDGSSYEGYEIETDKQKIYVLVDDSHCRAAGLKAYQIRGETVPDGLFEERADFPVSLRKLIDRDVHNCRTCSALMAANDDHDIGACTREARGKKLGKRVGINFRVVD